MDNNSITPIPIFVSFSRIVINRDVVHQQEQPSDITMNINNHINYYSFPPSPAPPQLVPDDNHIQSTTMNKDIQTEYQEEEEEEEEQHTDEDDDNKTITEHESNDSDHDSIYQTPPTSDNDNEDDNLD